MGRSIVFEVLEKPVASSISALLIGIWLWLTNKGLGYAEVGYSYDSVVGQREVWRLLTAVVSHVELLHLLFNVSALWGLSGTEAVLGSVEYLRTTLLLIVLSDVVALALYHIIIVWGRREQFRRMQTLGYSGVLFGWMAVVAVDNPGGMSRVSLFGVLQVPMALAPFGSLLLTSLLIPRASFVGHLAGILAGYAIAFGAFDWLTLWWALGMAFWVFIGAVYCAVRGFITLPFIRVHAPEGGDVESGLLPSRLLSIVDPQDG